MTAGWSFIVYDYAYKFDNFYLSVCFFISLHFVTVFLLALIGGYYKIIYNKKEK